MGVTGFRAATSAPERLADDPDRASRLLTSSVAEWRTLDSGRVGP